MHFYVFSAAWDVYTLGRLYFVDRPRGRRPIQKDRDTCLFASFGCSSENESHSWKEEGRGNLNAKGCFLPLNFVSDSLAAPSSTVTSFL